MQLVECRTSKLSIDAQMVVLCRAFEKLHKQHGLSTTDLSSKLSPTNKDLASQILNDAAREIRNLSISISDATEFDVLGSISQRVTSALGKENKFGLSFIDLLKLYDFPDADVLGDHYARNPRADGQLWPQVLSKFRGAVIHEGHFDLGGKYDLNDVCSVVFHLQDILTRIILKTAGFESHYRNDLGMFVLVDWVKDVTPAAQLGYK